MGAAPAQNNQHIRNQLKKENWVVIGGFFLLCAIMIISEGIVRRRFGPTYVRYADAIGIPLTLAWVWSFAIAFEVKRSGWTRRPVLMIGAVTSAALILSSELVYRGLLPGVWIGGLSGLSLVGYRWPSLTAMRVERGQPG